MPCYHPLSAWYAQKRNEETRKRPITFRFAEGYKDRPVQVPCGTCLGCRLERAREWAVRCMHEASLHERNCFLTLTYDDEHLPAGSSLRPGDVVKFMKRVRHKFAVRERFVKGCFQGKRKLRKIYGYRWRDAPRFFQCGEYGEREGRPHHHLVLFGADFSDKEFFRERNGVRLYTSRELAELWPFGFSTVGDVTFDSAGYVARYTLKKVGQSNKPVDGRVAEYLTMSRRPGIGRGWIDRFMTDVYPSDELVVNGHVTKPPRYYDDQAAKRMPKALDEVKTSRRGAGSSDPDSKGTRLVVREVVKEAACRPLARELEV